MKTRHFLFSLVIFIVALASCTPEEQPPTISYVFSDVSVDAGQTSATITCRNKSVDDNKVHASVLMSKNENITDATKYPMRLQNDTLRSTINGLESNTMYYFCFEVYTANEHKRTDEMHHFQTTGGGNSGGIVTVTTSEAINVTQTTATGGGSVTAADDYTVSMRGVCWDTVPSPNVVQSPHLLCGEGMGSFMANITGLLPGTIYYMRAYAVCNDMTYYGNEISFTTQACQAPTVTTGEVSNITRTTALASGNVTDDGGAEVTRRGVCWGTSHNPTANGNHADSGTGTGAYTVELTGLTANTTYYVRAYAENAQGLSYGEEVEFKTAENLSSPTVVTGNVEGTTAHGEVTADGGAEVTERGVCWSTSHNPTTSGSHATSGTGTGSFSVELNGLTPGTTYYVRAYAINSVGTAYGNEVTFSTSANKPTVTTEEVSNISQTTAQGGGNVTADGGAEVTERGICWSTSHNPTTSGSHATANNGGTGGYTVNMTGLTANTTYYVRAYATNSQGTSYGGEVSFQTSLNLSAPTVTTSQVTDIASTTATGGGNVTNDGGATVTARGICWSTSHNPTVSGSHTTNGTGTGSFTSSMTGLSANTTYYVRAYATNSQGTAYGSEESFTTSQIPTYTIGVSANPTGGGTVSGGGTYQQGQSCTVSATAATGYTFLRWTENGSQVSANANYTFTVTSSRTLVANFTYNGSGTAPTGAINGKFTINANGDKVYFSQGNLQYQASTNTWRFATNQYGYIGSTNSNISQTYNGRIDLFGWGTSGYNHGAACYQPWSTSQNYAAYYAYGQSTYNLYDHTGRADWGYNAISNGGNQAGQWRTLTGSSNGEWNYIFNTRNASTVNGVANARYAKAKVANVQGVILFPDEYTHPIGVAQPVGINETGDAGWNGNDYSASDFASMQDAGAVFLPAAGGRFGTSVNAVGSGGYYWSASHYGSGSAWGVGFSGTHLSTNTYYILHEGRSVRLVCPAEN